jgi:hypothetical protein
VLTNTPIQEWHHEEMVLDLKLPYDTDTIPVRCVTATANGKTLSKEFENDFDIDYTVRNKVISQVHKTVGSNAGLTDVFILLKDYNLALRLYKLEFASYELDRLETTAKNGSKFSNIIMVNSWEELKNYV